METQKKYLCIASDMDIIGLSQGWREEKNMSKYTFDYKPEYQQSARDIINSCYNDKCFIANFTFYLHYDDAKLVHGDFASILESKSFMLDCKVWRILEDWEKKEIWLETH